METSSLLSSLTILQIEGQRCNAKEKGSLNYFFRRPLVYKALKGFLFRPEVLNRPRDINTHFPCGNQWKIWISQ
jgi:hypothetical protein